MKSMDEVREYQVYTVGPQVRDWIQKVETDNPSAMAKQLAGEFMEGYSDDPEHEDCFKPTECHIELVDEYGETVAVADITAALCPWCRKVSAYKIPVITEYGSSSDGAEYLVCCGECGKKLHDGKDTIQEQEGVKQTYHGGNSPKDKANT